MVSIHDDRNVLHSSRTPRSPLGDPVLILCFELALPPIRFHLAQRPVGLGDGKTVEELRAGHIARISWVRCAGIEFYAEGYELGKSEVDIELYLTNR